MESVARRLEEDPKERSRDDRRDLDLSGGVFDIETQDWDTFVCGGHLDPSGAYLAYDWKAEDDFVDHLLSIEGTLWAHSGGTFDFKWILDHALHRGLKVRAIASGSSIVKLWLGKRLALMDSHALFKISLAKLTAAQAVKKVKLELPCRCGKECGGYCSIRRDMPAREMKQVLYYLEQDCRSLFDAIEGFRAYAAAHDLDLCATVGSSAWRNAKRYLGLGKSALDSWGHKAARRSYYGGRTQVLRPYAESGFECDANAMYPSMIASVPLPVGEVEALSGRDAALAFERGREGVFMAKVLVPPMHIPPLPRRCGTGRIAYPTGAFVGTWTAPELRYAAELGVSVDVSDGLIWEGSGVVFEPWVKKIWGLRFEAPGGKSGPLGTWLKFIANSLTGKLGMDPLRETIEFDPDLKSCRPKNACRLGGDADCGRCCRGVLVDGRWTRAHCSGWCGSHKPVFPELGIYSKQVWRIDDCAHPEWAAYLTSSARVLLHRQLVADGEGGLTSVYCDTDSVFSTTRRTWRMGDQLGEFEDRGPFSSFRALAPKVYSYEKGPDLTVRAKGIFLPKKPTELRAAFEALADGKSVGEARSGIIGFKAGARRGKFFMAGSRLRRVRDIGYGDRFLTPDGWTRPPTAKECQERWA